MICLNHESGRADICHCHQDSIQCGRGRNFDLETWNGDEPDDSELPSARSSGFRTSDSSGDRGLIHLVSFNHDYLTQIVVIQILLKSIYMIHNTIRQTSQLIGKSVVSCKLRTQYGWMVGSLLAVQPTLLFTGTILRCLWDTHFNMIGKCINQHRQFPNRTSWCPTAGRLHYRDMRVRK